ncbi:Uncharacterised protein [Mycobacteroides abscessus subsp. abscessus]|nr:Uncharacterised protein [Mycobacteroides abscessus subsp. abscessus]
MVFYTGKLDADPVVALNLDDWLIYTKGIDPAVERFSCAVQHLFCGILSILGLYIVKYLEAALQIQAELNIIQYVFRCASHHTANLQSLLQRRVLLAIFKPAPLSRVQSFFYK